MSDAANALIQSLRDRASRDALSGITVFLRVSGGTPGQGLISDELRLTQSEVVAHALSPDTRRRDVSSTMPASVFKELLLRITEGAADLIPRSEAHFIPDTIVGQIIAQIDSQEVGFFFLPNARQARQHGRALSPNALRLVENVMQLRERFLDNRAEPL